MFIDGEAHFGVGQVERFEEAAAMRFCAILFISRVEKVEKLL